MNFGVTIDGLKQLEALLAQIAEASAGEALGRNARALRKIRRELTRFDDARRMGLSRKRGGI